MTGTDTGALASVLAEALAEAGRTLDGLSATEAIELADALRAVLAARPTPSPCPLDVRLAADLDAAAALIEREAGTG